ncbi:MAG: hypothetical protein J7623_26275 [Chitinophaga sp.]|uniref:hypothetical protein n=1 Tax=Chitinophaga sp. TaxID=1869181 RepID=UPI001B1BB9CD|nr:hypothetical protein [Chitinophaga sp.]MBO9732176.1 hypothetical protein [Chitinophaga sp.]
MRTFVALLLLALSSFHDNPPVGNPRYDFTDSIKAVSGNAYWHLNYNMDRLSVAGHAAEAVVYEDSLNGRVDDIFINLREDKVIDARQYILDQADKYRIIMINEAHGRAEHRLFTKSLLGALSKKGYNVFMAEGIWPHHELDKNHYPVSTDGLYLNEPNYGELIRYAFKSGYQVKSYEYDAKPGWDDSIKLDQYGSIKYLAFDPPDSMIITVKPNGERDFYFTLSREKGQAANIYKVMQANPKSKFVIHVGHAHLNKDGTMMGSQLAMMAPDVPILAIDQDLTLRTTVIDSLTKDTLRQSRPYVLQRRRTGRCFRSYYSVDCTIMNVAWKDSLLRPDYLFRDIEPRTVYRIPSEQLKEYPCMFAAYLPDELKAQGAKAIAIDVVYMNNAGEQPPLLLYKGKYTILKKTGNGIYSSFDVDIK